MNRLADFCFRRRRLVVAAWLVALAAALVVIRVVPPRYHADYQTPGAEATRAFDFLGRHFTNVKGDSIDLVFAAEEGIATPANRAAIEALVASVRAFPHVASVDSPFDDGGLAAHARTRTAAFAVVNLDRTIDQLANLDTGYAQAFLSHVQPGRHGSLQVEVTTLTPPMTPGNETLALAFAACVLLLAFGTLAAAALPIVTSLFGLGVGTAIGAALTRLVDCPDWAMTVATMIGLGVGIDYALFIVTRHRAGLAAGLAPEDALRGAMATAGRSISLAGGIVVLSLLGMLTLGLGYMNGVLAMSVVAVLSMLAASLTLLPAALGFVGTGIDRLRVPGVRTPGAGDDRDAWFRWSRAVQRHPWIAFGSGTLVLALLTLPVLSLRLGLPDDGNRPETETSRRAYDLLTAAFGPGINGPILAVLDGHGEPLSPFVADALEEVKEVDGVALVAPPVPGASPDAAVVAIYPTTSPQARETERLVERLRREVLPDQLGDLGITAIVGGFTAVSMDLSAYIGHRLPAFIGCVVLLAFLMLTAVFRAPVVAFKASVMNLLSIAAAYGVMAYAVDGTWLGRLLGIPETPVPAFVPLITFAVLFGLSMDYEVFLLSRIREEFERSGDNSDAVAAGLAATGRVITAAALIMVFVFGVFIFDPNVFIKQIGLGLTVAVLVDATVVRVLLVPAAMELLGDRNWWLPGWLGNLLPDRRERVAAPTWAGQEEPG